MCSDLVDARAHGDRSRICDKLATMSILVANQESSPAVSLIFYLDHLGGCLNFILWQLGFTSPCFVAIVVCVVHLSPGH